MPATVQKAIETLGYRLLPPAHRGSPGGGGLLVLIRNEPTRKHFDPMTLSLRLQDRRGVAKWRSLSLRGPEPDSDRVCPGRLILSDRSGKRVEFFAFGGSLAAIPVQDACVYELHSPAPVLELVPGEETIAVQLAAETESLLGQQGVRWAHNEEGFNRRLVEVAPLQFYMGTLCTLLEQYGHCRSLEETYQDLCSVLRCEKGWLISHTLWPEKPPMLEDLLSPDGIPSFSKSSDMLRRGQPYTPWQ